MVQVVKLLWSYYYHRYTTYSVWYSCDIYSVLHIPWVFII